VYTSFIIILYYFLYLTKKRAGNPAKAVLTK